MYFYNYDSEIGVFTLVSDGENLIQLRMDSSENTGNQSDHPVFRQTSLWLDRYFRGEKPDPFDLPIVLHGTEFQKKVWSILLAIPHGESRTYGSIAREMEALLGVSRMSAQAIGGAVGKNPIAIIVPCHRVLAAGERLGGYAGGTDKKKWLLRHEGISFKEETT